SVENGFQAIKVFLLLWIGVVFFGSIMAAVISYYSAYVSVRALDNFMLDSFRRALRLDIKRFEAEKTGEILRKFDNANDAVWQIVFFGLYDLVQSSTIFVAALTIGLITDWRLTCFALIPIPFVILFGIWNMHNREQHQQVEHKYWEKIYGHVGDSFTNIYTVKSYTAEGRSINKLANMFKVAVKNQLRVSKGWAQTDAMQSGVWIGGRLLIFIAGVWLVLSGATTIGTLIMFLGLTTYFFGSVQRVVMRMPHISRMLTRMDRWYKIWSEMPQVQEKKGARRLKKAKGGIEFKNVYYRYQDKTKNVLKGISFKVEPGQTFALVGSSGAGKSTLAKMMLRFFDPTQGMIFLDDYDLRDLTLNSLRQSVGFVMQENLLFHTTILDNIRYAKPGAKKNEIIKAAKRAQAHDFIMKLEKGYDTVVGERGVKLSGGEKQRIALAQVILENPSILVLDEATSALDSKTEYELQKALAEVMKNRTTLVIAHRLSTVMAADNTLVMEEGKIVDQGTHDELVHRSGPYKDFWKIQAGGYAK
ncbi:MAG: ABC transporter ATP-binding protein, partial [Patescibacteria group bacterium]